METGQSEKQDGLRTVREYVKEVVVIDGVKIIRKVRERECKMCKWYPFGIWIGQWVVILGGTGLLILFFWGS